MQDEVLLLGPWLAPLADQLAPEINVHRYWDSPDPAALLRRLAPRLRALATDAFTGASAELMTALPRLELIANFGVGYDTIDLACARSRGITVTNTPGVLDDDVADLAMALMLAAYRRIPEADRFVRTGKWSQGAFPLARKLTGRRLGILGLGRIGKALARRAAGFDLEIGYHGRNRQPEQAARYFASLTELARWSDILVVLVPDTDQTRGMVDQAVIEALGSEGLLINVARGAIVDEPALVAALSAGTLGGAGLDVYAHEPEVPPALLTLDQVVLLPHLGSATIDTRQAMADLVVANLRAYFSGQPLLTPVT